jgi:hypothetical protein
MLSPEITIINKATNPPATPATGGNILGPKPSKNLWGWESRGGKRAQILATDIVQATKNMASLYGGQTTLSKNPNPSTRKNTGSSQTKHTRVRAWHDYQGQRVEEAYG